MHTRITKTNMLLICIVKEWNNLPQHDSLVEAESFKVAQHSFQVSMPNLSLLLNYFCFGAHFLQESRLTTELFILAFWLGCVLLPWQWDCLKARFKNWFLFILKKSSR